MAEARAEQVEREDVVNFLSAALVGTGQAEFYDTADEQTFTLDFLHEYMRVAYRRLYARTLALVRPTGGRTAGAEAGRSCILHPRRPHVCWVLRLRRRHEGGSGSYRRARSSSAPDLS
jgi:hypothetical protein